MNELSSTEFRRRFPKLTARTIVTVNGHPIGTWDPSPLYRTVGEMQKELFGQFRPAPKPGKR